MPSRGLEDDKLTADELAAMGFMFSPGHQHRSMQIHTCSSRFKSKDADRGGQRERCNLGITTHTNSGMGRLVAFARSCR